MAKTIVILGAGLASIPVAHYLLKYTSNKTKDLKVILVSPNTHLYWPIASVRAIVPDMLDDDKISLPLAEAFAKYPSKNFELVQGKADKVNPVGNTVDVLLNDASSRTITYNDLYDFSLFLTFFLSPPPVGSLLLSH